MSNLNSIPIIGASLTDLDTALERTKIQINNPDAILPNFVTGARAKILIAGKPIGAALNITWSVNIKMEELFTIDSQIPWEIIPGQIMIRASLSRFIDPFNDVAGAGLFSTIQANIHQPYVTLQVSDKISNNLFTAKGMFSDISSTISNGSVGLESVNFVGYYFRTNVQQDFDANVASSFEGLIKSKAQSNPIAKGVSSLI